MIRSQKPHWFGMFDPGEGEPNNLLIFATFLSLALLMKMESELVHQLLLEAGLAMKKIINKFLHSIC